MEAEIDNRKLRNAKSLHLRRSSAATSSAAAREIEQLEFCAVRRSLATMFAQGQLLGMQTDLLNRLKVEVNAWEKVAEKHPCAAQF